VLAADREQVGVDPRLEPEANHATALVRCACSTVQCSAVHCSKQQWQW
jgi:hypothetical protein